MSTTKESDDESEASAELEALLVAAMEEFESVGLSRSSLDAVARQAGTSRSTVYRRFGDKQALALAVAERLVASVEDELGRRTIGCTPQESVVAAFLGLVDVVGSNKLLRRILFQEPSTVRGLVTNVRGWSFTNMAERVQALLRARGAAMPDDELLKVSELLVRIACSYTELPSDLVPFDDAARVEAFSRTHLTRLVY